MQDVLLRLVEVPMVRMFVLSGLIFLMIAVLGKIEGKIEPGRIGRIGSAVLGVVLILIGLIMQFGENHDIYAKLPPNMVSTLPPQAATAPASAIANVETANIKVVSGTWGRNCNGKAGNASALVAKACDGHGSCDYMIDTSTLEDPAPNCEKDFAVEWKCGSGNAVYSATLSGLTGKNDKLRLSCAN